jgi:hypothetical protein
MTTWEQVGGPTWGSQQLDRLPRGSHTQQDPKGHEFQDIHQVVI